MAPPSRVRSGAQRLDLIAASWGGLIGSIGLMVAGGRDWPLRLGVTAAAFLIGGIVASARVGRGIVRHSMAMVVAAYVIHAAFVALAAIIDRSGGPGAPELVPNGDGGDWIIVLGWSLGFALAGGGLAKLMTRPRRPVGRFGSR